MLFNFAIRKVKENQLELKVNTETLIDVSKEVGLEM
jgi:hypothetical protein